MITAKQRRLKRLKKDLTRRWYRLQIAVSMQRKDARFREEDWAVIRLAAEDVAETLALLEIAKVMPC